MLLREPPRLLQQVIHLQPFPAPCIIIYNVMSPQAERTLIEQAKTDPQAFGVIFDRHYQKLLAYTIRRTGDVTTAEEIVSNTFFKAMQAVPRFEWRGVSIEAWLFRIAINELRMHFRAHKPTVSLNELHEDGFEPPAEQDIAREAMEAQEALERQQQAQLAIRLIRDLPQDYQDVLVLRFSEGKKVSEIATILQKKEGTVKSLLSRGLARLRTALAQVPVQPSGSARIVDIVGRQKPRPEEYER